MQIFPRELNFLPLIGALVGVGGLVTPVALIWYYGSALNTQVGHAPVQPVAYSHRLHAGELGIDCRYCHANVENSQEAMIPPTQTCMGCHSAIKTESEKLQPVRDSWENDTPVEWVRVHKIPEHAYFDHSVHLAAGVGCASCHGRVDQMEVVRQQEPLSMSWCLDCHRDPGPHLRPKDQITNMNWKPAEDEDEAAVLARAEQVNPPEHCSGCHR